MLWIVTTFDPHLLVLLLSTVHQSQAVAIRPSYLRANHQWLMNRNSKTTQAALGHLRDCICAVQLVPSRNTNHRYVANFTEMCTWSRVVATSAELGDKNYRPGASALSASTVSQYYDVSRSSVYSLLHESRTGLLNVYRNTGLTFSRCSDPFCGRRPERKVPESLLPPACPTTRAGRRKGTEYIETCGPSRHHYLMDALKHTLSQFYVSS